MDIDKNERMYLERIFTQQTFFIFSVVRIHTRNTHNEILVSIKKNEIWPCAATWMDPGFIIPSEVSQTEKNKW